MNMLFCNLNITATTLKSVVCVSKQEKEQYLETPAEYCWVSKRLLLHKAQTFCCNNHCYRQKRYRCDSTYSIKINPKYGEIFF